MALRAVELRRLLLPRVGGGEAVLPTLAWRGRRGSTAAPADDELAGKSAYEVLGVGETSSNAEIKASFHRLAKETHPDVAAAAGSQRFLQILAAYEVKHMHWYQVGDKVSPCECRCSRARLPPSRYWLFEPRCYMHDTGGWYIETYGRDKKGRTIPSQRQWDGLNEHSEKRLHPAMYLVALAYRSLDLEDARRGRWNMSNFLQLPLSHILQLLKKFVNGKKGIDMRTP